jgi:hypothetical protein
MSDMQRIDGMTKTQARLLDELAVAIVTADAPRATALWRKLAPWHGLNPDLAVVLLERQAEYRKENRNEPEVCH